MTSLPPRSPDPDRFYLVYRGPDSAHDWRADLMVWCDDDRGFPLFRLIHTVPHRTRDGLLELLRKHYPGARILELMESET